jgi:3-oxo-5alpha-steroid 4-dehydrogenase
MSMNDNALIRDPRIVDSADEVVWDDTADLVVVGFGGAGAVTALQAAELGASVIAVDRFDGGGATQFSGGVVYAGATKYLKDSGYDDTAEEMFKYLDAEKSAVSQQTLRRFCEGSSDDIDWLDSHGVPHGSNAFEDKTAFPPDNHFLYYSGNEKMPHFAARAKPAPRGHRVAINGFGGKVLYSKLRESALAKKVNLIPHAPVQRLVMDRVGRVLGIQVNSLPENLWQEHQAHYKKYHPWIPMNGNRAERGTRAARELENSVHRPRYIRGNRGVVITTGGYNNSYEMTRQYRPVLAEVYKNLLRLGSMADDGSGMKLAESAGGVLDLMQNVSVARTLVPPNVYGNGIVVNARGERFVNEAAYAFNVGNAIADQPDKGRAWLILEGDTFYQGIRDSFRTGKNFLIWGLPPLINIFFGGTRRGKSLEALAKKIQVDPNGLVQTVANFNTIAEAGENDPLGKIQDLVKPIRKGPFYAVNLCLDNRVAPSQTMTVGGIKVNEDSGAVVRADGTDIPGLYAAGRAAVGICSGGFISGLSLADVVFSGRRAARAAVDGS